MGEFGGIAAGLRLVTGRSVEQRAAHLVARLALHDAPTGLHSARVGEISAAIARELGWGVDDVARARITGMVHDAGKLITPKAILAKPAALTDAERAVIQLHAPATERVAASFGIPEDIARAASLHHEMPSGAGYPFGLAGPELPELTSVVSTADIFEAMTGLRPYRSPLAPADALVDLRTRVGRGELLPGPVEALGRWLAANAAGFP